MTSTQQNGYLSTIYDYSYTYDANGNRTEDINNLTTQKAYYIYDDINQLLEEGYSTSGTVTKRITYTYDELGNRLTKSSSGTTTTYQYDPVYKELLSQNNTYLFKYDGNGNIISAGSFGFAYDRENRMTSVSYQGVLRANYEYDWRGLRTKKSIVNGKTELYYYTGNDIAYITDELNNLKYYFVRDTAGRLLQMIDYTATPAKTYNYILDVHGSVIGLADERGTVISYEYDAWGNLLNTPDETVLTGNGEKLAEANPFRYSSYQYDRESGYYYLKYRYYSPFTGRFMSMDPVVSYNRYMYCGNNPVNYVDPLGLATQMVSLEDGGRFYEKFVYVSFKVPVVSNNKVYSGYFVNTNKTGNFEDIGSEIGKVQFEGELRMPVSIGNELLGGSITRVNIQTYKLDGQKYIRTNYTGPSSSLVVDTTLNLAAVGTLVSTGLKTANLVKAGAAVAAIAEVSFIAVIGGLVGLFNLIEDFAPKQYKPRILMESQTYQIE